MSARRTPSLALLAAVATLALPAAGALADHHHHGTTKLKGAWTNPVGACVQHIISFDSATGATKCTGTSAWTGTWNGSTKWTFTGTLSPSTGAGSGRIDEVFAGRAHDGRRGRLTFVEHVTLGAGGATDIKGHIVGSCGGLAGSHGRAHWVGTTSATDGSGSGRYSGRWQEGNRRKRCG
jgi:hypothetical protein